MSRCLARALHGLINGAAAILLLAASAAPGRAGERPGAGAWLLGLELQQRNFDTMSAGDPRPTARGETGARVSLDHLLAPRWALELSGHYGGSWLDWSDPLYRTSGKLEDTSWDVRLGADRVLAVGVAGMAFVGAGIEYGEAHSWIHTIGVPPESGQNTGQNIDDEGPRCYMTGGYARLAVMTPMCRRMALWAQASQSYYGAHASDPPFGIQYNWLGRSLAATVGLRYAIARGRASGE